MIPPDGRIPGTGRMRYGQYGPTFPRLPWRATPLHTGCGCYVSFAQFADSPEDEGRPGTVAS